MKLKFVKGAIGYGLSYMSGQEGEVKEEKLCKILIEKGIATEVREVTKETPANTREKAIAQQKETR